MKLNKLLCLFGCHQWHPLTSGSILNPVPVERCERCGIGRQLHWAGEIRWSRQEMEKAQASITEYELVRLIQKDPAAVKRALAKVEDALIRERAGMGGQ